MRRRLERTGSTPRRSRADVRMAAFLAIGQTWRAKDTGALWTIRQVYRADCEAMLRGPAGEPRLLSFADLRAEFAWHGPAPLRVVA